MSNVSTKIYSLKQSIFVERTRIFNFRQEADLAICDLTITSSRESIVDFTMPFMNLGMIS